MFKILIILQFNSLDGNIGFKPMGLTGRGLITGQDVTLEIRRAYNLGVWTYIRDFKVVQ